MRVSKRASRKPRAKKLVREMYGGESYEYYALGKYIVAAPKVCHGEPTFKYTRIQVIHSLDLIAAGWTIEKIASEWWSGRVSADAIREAVRLAERALQSNSSVGMPIGLSWMNS